MLMDLVFVFKWVKSVIIFALYVFNFSDSKMFQFKVLGSRGALREREAAGELQSRNRGRLRERDGDLPRGRTHRRD